MARRIASDTPNSSNVFKLILAFLRSDFTPRCKSREKPQAYQSCARFCALAGLKGRPLRAYIRANFTQFQPAKNLSNPSASRCSPLSFRRKVAERFDFSTLQHCSVPATGFSKPATENPKPATERPKPAMKWAKIAWAAPKCRRAQKKPPRMGAQGLLGTPGYRTRR